MPKTNGKSHYLLRKRSLLRCVEHNDAYLTLGSECNRAQKTGLLTLEQYNSTLESCFVTFPGVVAHRGTGGVQDPLGHLL